MHLLVEEGPEIAELATQVSTCLERLLGALSVELESIKIPGSTCLRDVPEYQNSVFILTEGNVHQHIEGKPLVIFEPGDLFIVQDGFESDFRTDFAVVVHQLSYSDFLETCCSSESAWSLWSDFLLLRQDFFLLLSASLIREELHFEPSFHTFSPGEVIIEQGDNDSNVYTMNEGKADVIVDGVKVGEVLTDEIFGALAALTGTPRTARVVATEPSLVLSLPGDKFAELTRSRPATVSKMVSDMARTIVDLNNRLIDRN